MDQQRAVALYDAMKAEMTRLEDLQVIADSELLIAEKYDFPDLESWQRDFDIARARVVGAFIMFKMLHEELGYQ